MTSVWLITPAYRRYDLSEVCFAQHAWVAKQLAPKGVRVTSCVIADDHNLELAKAHGFATVRRRNDFLGARFNDGMQFAAAEKADFVVPLGSDSWIHPSFFEVLPDPAGSTLVTGRYYALVDEAGEKLARLSIKVAGGVGPNVIPARMLEQVGWRPYGNELQRGCDHSLLTSLQSAHRVSYAWRNLARLQYVGWRTQGMQLNSYVRLVSRYGDGEELDPWKELPLVFPGELVDAARLVYERRAQAAA